MTEAKENSSLPLLLGITGAIVAVAVGGWFYLNQQSSPADGTGEEAALVEAPAEELATEPASEESETAVAEEALPAAAAATDVEAELRKARLASDADILVLPPSQSALYYYGRVLAAEPEHPVAGAELEAVLARVSQTVTQHLVDEEWSDAWQISSLVARYQPEHALVIKTEQALESRAEQMVQQAIQLAQNGDEAGARAMLNEARQVPGRNPQYFAAVLDSINEIRDVRAAADRDRAERAQLAATEARGAWASSVRNAIQQGNLITPAGASAYDLLAETNSWNAERAQLTGELVDALAAATQAYIDLQEPDNAEATLAVVAELGGSEETLGSLRAGLEQVYVNIQSNTVVDASALTKTNNVAARYPRRAQDRNLSGWVVVAFTVGPDGETSEIEVSASEPERVFDNAAIEAVERWAFEPVEYRGQLISQRAAARLVFRLE